jgi:hypothetical protein
VANRKETPVKGTDLVTTTKYTAFELGFEFNFTEAANSGVKYFIGNGGPNVGYEFQVLDDKKHPDANAGENGNRKMGSLYDLIPANKQDRFTKPAGEWNIARIVVRPDNHVEHWLNGMKVVEFDRDSEALKQAISRSKFSKIKDFAGVPETPILLQYHNDEVKFRSIKIKKLTH